MVFDTTNICLIAFYSSYQLIKQMNNKSFTALPHLFMISLRCII